LNNRILTNEDYQNTNTKWEILKGTIQNQYTTKLKKETNKNETNIKKETRTSRTSTDQNKHTSEPSNRYNKQFSELDNINENKLNSIVLRAKPIHVENNENNSKYFANLGK